MTQAKLAELTDLSTGFIGDIETGRANPSLQNIELIADALGIQPYLLFMPKSLQQNFRYIQLTNIMEEVREVLERYTGDKEPEDN